MKPDNIIVGSGKNSNKFYLIDFGLSKRYIDPKTGKHIKDKTGKGIIGTTQFLSLNANGGHEHSRKDDLESLGYILVHFMKGGNLPWSDVPLPEPPGLYAHDLDKEYFERL